MDKHELDDESSKSKGKDKVSNHAKDIKENGHDCETKKSELKEKKVHQDDANSGFVIVQ